MSIDIRHLPRYAEVAWLLWRHGRDLMSSSELPPELAAPPELDDEPAAPESLAADLERLGPTFVKLGQLLSTRADLIPEGYLEALARLQDQVAPLAFAEVESVVHGELGVRLSKAFAEFDPEPLASASLAQVHRARLRDGRPVAVKVQRPGVRQRVVEDLEMLADLAELLDGRWDSIDLPAVVADLRRTLLRELDFRHEASHLRRLGAQLARCEELLVPRAVDDYTTSKVLTMQLVSGRKLTELHPVARIDLDGERLAEALFRAYLESVLVEGFFHADPHPGNVLLTDDHRIALIDLGMVGELSQTFREKLLRLLVALSDGSGDETADAAIDLGRPTDRFDESEFRSEIETLVRRLADRTVEKIQVGRVVLEVTRIASASGIAMPREFSMLGKTLLNLDQIAQRLAPDFDPNAAIRRHAADIAQRQLMSSLSPSSWLARFLEIKGLLEALPGRLNKLFETVSEGGLKIDVEAIDEDLLISGFQKVANRITAGLVLAALIVGAALIMRIPTELELFGYPALAIVLFLGAALGGAGLLWNIWRHDRRAAARRR